MDEIVPDGLVCCVFPEEAPDCADAEESLASTSTAAWTDVIVSPFILAVAAGNSNFPVFFGANMYV